MWEFLRKLFPEFLFWSGLVRVAMACGSCVPKTQLPTNIFFAIKLAPADHICNLIWLWNTILCLSLPLSINFDPTWSLICWEIFMPNQTMKWSSRHSFFPDIYHDQSKGNAGIMHFHCATIIPVDVSFYVPTTFFRSISCFQMFEG